ncbi:hypothetical protein AN958_07179 [Leucoagaricus sp. SymC.cos]|nr:hypothetical protein AN958_07179 [Leucoagaricus sp. SymC.cos]
MSLVLASQQKPSFKINFPDVPKISDPITITQCGGPCVNDDNLSHLLGSAIEKSGLDTRVLESFKEEEQFSLAALPADSTVCGPDGVEQNCGPDVNVLFDIAPETHEDVCDSSIVCTELPPETRPEKVHP